MMMGMERTGMRMVNMAGCRQSSLFILWQMSPLALLFPMYRAKRTHTVTPSPPLPVLKVCTNEAGDNARSGPNIDPLENVGELTPPEPVPQ